MIESYDRMRLQKQKENVLRDFALADVIGNRIGVLFTDKKKRKDTDLVKPWQIWPGLFAEEEQKGGGQNAEAKDKSADVHKAQLQAFAQRWNNRRKE